MANTRSRSRRASSDQPKPHSNEQKYGREEGSIKVEPTSSSHVTGRGGSPSLMRNTPQVKLEPVSDSASDSGEESEEGGGEQEVQVKVEVVSDTGSDTEDSEEAKDEVPELDHIAALRLAQVPNARSARATSVLSIDDAKSTIDSFFTKPETFMSDKKNKLKFWQSLCIEFGLVDMDADADLDSDLSTVNEEDEDEDSDSDSGSSGSSGESSSLPPLPTSLNQANRLLKAEAHVNLQDYFAAREEEKQKMKAHRKSQRNRRKKGKKDKEMERTDLSHLVHPSSRAMIKYTIKHRKFVKVDRAKEAWLQPLLRSFRHRR